MSDITKVTREMLFDSENIKPPTLNWIHNYTKNSSYDNYGGHITIGFGDKIENLKTPIIFEAKRLALAQLGNNCTCRNIIFEVELKP